eukprot:CAMPEP_0174824198 /NCGR_PEP_ID=MMETSP1107-20130205/31741_1 /TAXON_ID=36770 /ORGANISM="Paraphysomonas vestita, Strain GFlagA" /LENGTH=94 /DNA_ID=CAMNT_0016050267 /DNA_START=287 /DNA_END=571 /DNA_ORIENTATION=+
MKKKSLKILILYHKFFLLLYIFIIVVFNVVLEFILVIHFVVFQVILLMELLVGEFLQVLIEIHIQLLNNYLKKRKKIQILYHIVVQEKLVVLEK